MRLEHGVAAGVIAVMVRVDQQIDGPRRPRLDAVEALLRGIRKLRVHHDHAIRRDQPPDGAAARGEKAGVTPHRRERARHRRRRLAQGAARRDAERGGQR